MSRYRITDEDIPYAAEFRADPLGIPSPGLQRVMNRLRGEGKDGKFVLIVKAPFERWVLGRLPAQRGRPVEIMPGYEFTDLAEAEWTVFRLRWKAETGMDLEDVL